MSTPRAGLMASAQSRGRNRGRNAAAIAIASLVGWPAAVAASELVTSVSPPAVEDVQDILERAVDDAKGGLGNAVESVERVLEAEGGGTRGDPQGESELPGVAARESRDAGVRARPNRRTAQGRDESDDVDELVASGDEIGGNSAPRAQTEDRSERASEQLPFTGFDPAGLLLVGISMIFAGLALLSSARSRLAFSERARAG